jgi:hypothetical protein
VDDNAINQSSSQQDVHIPTIPYPPASKNPFDHSTNQSINQSTNQTIPSRAINYRVSMLDGLSRGPFYQDADGHPLSPRSAQIEETRRVQLIVAGETVDNQPIYQATNHSINQPIGAIVQPGSVSHFTT